MGSRWQTREVTSPQPVKFLSLRGALVAVLASLAVLHLLVAVGRSHDWALEGAALAGAGLAHAVATITLALTHRRRHLIAVATWIAVAAGALVITRTSGYPFGPFDGYSPSLSSYDATLLGLSLVAVALLVGVVLIDIETLGRGGWSFDTLAPLAAVVVAIPGLATTSWVDDASSLAGSGHVHYSATLAINDAELTWEQRSQLGREIARVREIALAHPTLAAALDAGWTLAGLTARGAGQLVVDASRDFRDVTFDIDSPHGLIYASNDPSAPVVGVQYAQWISTSDQPSGFTGQENLWHFHGGTCVIDGEFGEYALPLDEPTTGVGCQEVDGTRSDSVSFMIRAWVVPGWENPYGTFAHDHPSLR